MSDIVQRLRGLCCPDCADGDACSDCQKIYDGCAEIERRERERDEAKHLAAVFGCRDDYRHTEDECPLCRAEAELCDLRALLADVAKAGVAWRTHRPNGYYVVQVDNATWDAVQKIGGAQ